MPPISTGHGETMSLFGGGGNITFDWVPNPAVVAAQLDIAAARLEKVAEPLGLSREVAIADVEEHFAGQHGPDGGAWAPWASSYAERTSASSILTLTSEMRGAVTSRGAWPIDGTDLLFSGGGAPARWAWHQYGASRSGRGGGLSAEEKAHYTRMHEAGAFQQGVPLAAVLGENVLPARPFIGLSEDAKFKIIDIFDAWVAGTIAGITYPSRGGYTRAVSRSPTGQFSPLM